MECPEAVFVMTANLAKEAINDFSRLLRKMYASETGGPKTQATTKDGGDKVPATPEELIDEFKTKLRHGPLKVRHKHTINLKIFFLFLLRLKRFLNDYFSFCASYCLYILT